jgi:hypothetical protein
MITDWRAVGQAKSSSLSWSREKLVAVPTEAFALLFGDFF